MTPTPHRTRDLTAIAIASLFPLAMAMIYFVILDEPAGDENPAVRIAYVSGKVVQFLFPALFVFWIERQAIRLASPTWRGIPMAIGFATIVAVAMVCLYQFVLRDMPAFAVTAPEMIWHRLTQFKQTTPAAYVGMGVFICCVHSLGEEYYWRWFVFGWLRRHVPMWSAIVLSSLGFMAHHVVIVSVYFPNDILTLALPFSLGVAVGGGVWAWIYARSESLYAPWLSHCLIDVAIMAIGYVMLERFW